MAFKLNLPKSISSPKNPKGRTGAPPPGPQGARNKFAEFFDRHPVRRRLQILGGVLLVLLLGIGGIVFHTSRMAEYNAAYVSAAGDLRMLSQRIAKSAGLALRGDPAAFRALRETHGRFASLYDRLRNGGELANMVVPPSPPSVAESLDRLAATWGSTSGSITQLLKAESRMVVFGKYLRSIAAGDKEQPSAAMDDATHRTVAELEAAYDSYEALINGILGGAQDLVSARQAGSSILVDDAKLFEATEALIAAYSLSGQDAKLFYDILLAALAALMLAALAAMAWIYVSEARHQTRQAERSRQEAEMSREEAERSREESERANRQNQGAILRLMNELSDLADGDLTVMATVSEDITGAIADSINYTIEELRVLVGRINDAAGRVTAATEIAQQTSAGLLEAAQRQSREIQNAGHSVLEMASSMTRVSSDADQSAQVA
ncbi:MAG: methyl-accepting chemotaxis protein, partial [Candidatus Accumulibacter sp.]|nr:methyl-accepting chemotaxis protein [Accumulibacter sp.]